MANGGYTGALPARDDSPEAYSGVWESQEQYAELAAGRWAQQVTGLAPRSVRFNSADSARFTRTVSTASNRKTWTWSGWVKRAALGSNQLLFGSTSLWTELLFNSSNQLQVYAEGGSLPAGGIYLYSNAVFRDTSAWMHVVWVLDTTQSTAANRLRVYVNGQQITWTSSISFDQNLDFNVNSANVHGIGSRVAENNLYLNAYLASVYFIDGQALEPEAFGFFDGAGVWQPRPYRGTYGTNGFYLNFSDNSAATATALGADRSGNGNNWTPNAFAVTSNVGQYSSTWTYSATGSNPSGVNDPTGAFLSTSPTIADNSQQSGRQAYVNHNGGTSWIQLNPSSAITGSSLRVFTYQPQGTSGADTWMNINGGSDLRPWRVSANYTGWSNAVSIPGGSLTSLRMSLSYGGGSGIGFYAIEVDGVILREYLPADIDSLLDSPVNGRQSDTGLGGQVQGNYATWNPLISTTNLTNGNLSVVQPGAGAASRYSTIGMSSGKWYWEITVVKYANTVFGIRTPGGGTLETPYDSTGYGMGWRTSGGFFIGGGNTGTGSLSLAAGDVLGLGFDANAGTLAFYKNGSLVHTLTASASYIGQTWFAGSQDSVGGNSDHDVNFGQRPFAYQNPGTNRPSADFKALCTANLPEPAIKRGDDYFQTLLYTGNSSTQTLSGLRFSPDLVWLKNRDSGSYGHRLVDQVRGVSKYLLSHNSGGEGTEVAGITSLNPDGFSLGSQGDFNLAANRHCAWCWDAGSSTITLNPGDAGAGTLASTIRANPAAGFSIVTYAGVNSPGTNTIAHGLGTTPVFWIIKNRTNTSPQGWVVNFTVLDGSVDYMFLNLTNTKQDQGSPWNTLPTSTVITLGANDGNTCGAGSDYVAYCFAPIAGFSSFGVWTNNNSTDGAFIHTGMRPRFLLLKNTDNVEQWFIYDAARRTYNVQYPDPTELRPNSAGAEGSYNLQATVDFLSNGFKIRGNTGGEVAFGTRTYLYAAFAEHPFRSARAR